jgi:hypothetical protein
MGPRTLLLVVLTLAAACAERDQPESEPKPEAGPLDGFLHYLPNEVTLTARLPNYEEVAANRELYTGLLEQFGLEGQDPHALFHGAGEPEGLEREQGPGWCRTTSGVETLYLPATDKGLLNRALRGQGGDYEFREEGSWILRSTGGRGGGNRTGDPLPTGSLAFRAQYHPLLSVFAQSGDRLEASVTLAGPRDVRFGGVLRAPEEGTTSRSVAAAQPMREAGLLDFIPSSLALRVEFSLPPTILATFLTRRISSACGVAEGRDREVLERILREVITGADPAAGVALGIEFVEQETSIVAIGRLAEGEPSPILARLKQGNRISFGALVVDPRETPKGLLGFGAWLVDPDPRPDGVPTSALNLLVGLAGGEDDPLPVSVTEAEGWFFLGAGPRGDLLVQATRQRLLRSGAARSPGSQALFDLRSSGDRDDYVLGVVFSGAGLEGLDEGDRAGLARMVGLGAKARRPASLAIAGFKSATDELELLARLLY